MPTSSDPVAPLHAGDAAHSRRFSSPHQAAPLTHLLSSGPYSVMVTTAGSGYSRWRDIALTRWREDVTCDPWGSYVFLRDAGTGEVWSAGYQPLGTEPDRYAVEFFEDRAQFSRQDGHLVTVMEIFLAAAGDAEVRRISITNLDSCARDIDVTSYAEVVLATAAADSAHPAFSKMFVQTEFHAAAGALLATRRGSPEVPQLWLAHVSAMEGAGAALEFESDRAQFLGRGRELRKAAAVFGGRPLSNTAGTVLDPVFALRRRLRVEPGHTARAAFWTITAPTRTQAVAAAEAYCQPSSFDALKASSAGRADASLREWGIDPGETHAFQRAANCVLYSQPAVRASGDVLARNRLGQASLWTHGISGDLPIVLGRIDARDLKLVQSLLRAHTYWRAKGLAVDLVILNDGTPSEADGMQAQIEAMAATAAASVRADSLPGSGRAFLLRAQSLGDADRELLYCAARAIFAASRGQLTDQLAALGGLDGPPRPRAPAPNPATPGGGAPMPDLAFFNGLGGFTADGREYVTRIDEDRWTPAPWCNVIANADFGFMASTDGSCTTWSLNSRENQLTPWSNDPVANAPADVIYLRDMDSGALWSATPLPIRDEAPYLVRHGFGYTRCDHEADGIALELTQFVPLDGPVKIARLRITNRSGRARNLGITHYLDWVLGRERSRSAQFIVTAIDPVTGALLARNPWNASYPARVAFMDLCGRQQSWTADRREFLGRHGSLAEPAALLHGRALSTRVGGGLDPCGALQTQERLAPGEYVQLVFLLGEGVSEDEAAALVTRYRTLNPDDILQKVSAFWSQTLGAVQVKTPDRALDFMANGWFLYQALACRLWARMGFYQASGAYGFRDQLQDVMALCVARPELAREHILRAAARQFQAGDVQHWWLPSGPGIQTRISDNRIWLSFVTSHYMSVTGDAAILDEQVPFLEGGPLPPDQHELFASPRAVGSGSLFAHCALALDYSLQTGEHGLPLIGTGDWNDGMNRVGAAGRGESVWLGWFLYTALLAFAPVAEARGESARGSAWRDHARALLRAIEGAAWDGEWYRRGYFDDGTPLGSANSDECRIDSIAQSWAVLSGAGERSRAARAMSAVDAQLVDRGGDGLVRLFTPPFDRTPKDPGYIKAYPPGIRENGGQYTHAAAWAAWAFAALGDGDAAARLFSLLNPISHASTAAAVDRYKVEPYIACADVYSAPLHVGRGGWTWYTGSAGWMYRTALEAILGFTVHGGSLQLDPCIPRHWPGFEITYRFGSSTYHIKVANPSGVNRGTREIVVDGVSGSAGASAIPLVDDGGAHEVCVTLRSE